MLNEFCLITGASQESFEMMWEENEKLLLKYAPLESRRGVRNLLSSYEAMENECQGMSNIYSINYTYMCKIIMFCNISFQIDVQVMHSCCSTLT